MLPITCSHTTPIPNLLQGRLFLPPVQGVERQGGPSRGPAEAAGGGCRGSIQGGSGQGSGRREQWELEMSVHLYRSLYALGSQRARDSRKEERLTGHVAPPSLQHVAQNDDARLGDVNVPQAIRVKAKVAPRRLPLEEGSGHTKQQGKPPEAGRRSKPPCPRRGQRQPGDPAPPPPPPPRPPSPPAGVRTRGP